MSEFKVGDRVKYVGKDDRYLGLVGEIEYLWERDKIAGVDVGEELPYEFFIENLEFYDAKPIKTQDQQKVEELEQRIEKLEKCVIGEQNSLEKKENEPIYERNERFAKILKKELERNAIILNEPKPSLLTEDERVILRNLDKKWKWIAKDKFEGLTIFEDKPNKYYFIWCGKEEFTDFCFYDRLFQFIKWEDEEPYNIEELLKGECEE